VRACFKMALMYIHCFVFRWKPDVTDEQIERVAQEIRGLQGQIPGLLESYVGRNDSPRGRGYSFGGVMKFAEKASFEAYGPHPVHQKLLDWLMPLIEPLELDFEV
jgi:Stress responsive A/B Barrel Domain